MLLKTCLCEYVSEGKLRSKAQRNLKFSFSDPYEWTWSVIEIFTSCGDSYLWCCDHESWWRTMPLLSPHEQLTFGHSASSLRTKTLSEKVRENTARVLRPNFHQVKMLQHKGSIYITTYVGCKLNSQLRLQDKSPIKHMGIIPYNLPHIAQACGTLPHSIFHLSALYLTVFLIYSIFH